MSDTQFIREIDEELRRDRLAKLWELYGHYAVGAAVLIVAAAWFANRASAANAWRAVRRDAPHHRSPNAGYPEAAMGGALGLALAGPRRYGGVTVDDAMLGDGQRDATAADIRAALALYRSADALLIALAGFVAILVIATT